MGPHNLLYPAYLTFVGMLFFPFLIERGAETKPGTKHLFSEKDPIVYLNEPFESFPPDHLTLKAEDSTTFVPSIAELSGSTCGPGGITTDLYVWLRADKEAYNTGTTDATDGQTVATWNDQSTTDTDATSDGNPPTFKNNSTDNINFNPTLDFDGTNDRLTFGNLANIKSGATNGGDYTLIAVGLRQSGEGYLIGSPGGANNQDLHFGYRSSTVLTLDHYGNGFNFLINAYDNPAQTPFLILGDYDGTNRSLEEIRDGIFSSTTNSNTTDLSGSRAERLGNNSGSYFNGLIAEVIVYDNNISATDKDKIYSYLAIKYGIELDNTGGGTNGDYTNAAGTTLWDASANSTYHHDVAGIGRDDDSELNQKQAKSANTDAIVSMGLGSIATTNTSNSNSFSADNSFLLWGNDNAATAQASANSSDVPTGFTERISRVWKVEETGTVGNVEIQFDLSGLGYSTTLSEFSLIVSNSATMASGTLTAASSINGNVVSFTGVDLTNGQFFSLATETEKFPGGVTNDLYVWLKADKEAYNTGTTDATDGQTVATWNDQSTTDTDATSDGNPPIFKNNSTDNINFNPALDFDGTNDRLTFGNLANIKSGATNGGDYTLIAVGIRQGTIGYIIGSPGGVNDQDLHFGYRGSTALTLDHYGNGFNFFVNAYDNPAQTPFLILGDYDGTNRSLEQVRDGVFSSTTNSNTTDLSGTRNSYLGDESGSNFNGLIAEVIIYDNDLSATDKDKIYSYLAIKYGIELDNTGGGTNGDYTSAAGTTLWDASANSTYHNDVAGIGRDDDSGLNQKQSKSANTDAIVSIGLNSIAATNSANSNSFSADNSFMFWGNDDATTAQASANTADLPGGATERISRVWKVAETGTVGNVEIQFDLSGLGYGTNLDDFHLIVSNTATMASGTLTNASSINSNVVSFTGVDLTNGQFFSLATKGTVPGGVTTDLYVWLKADKEAYNTGTTDATDGQTVATWNDQSYTDTDAISDGNPPLFKNNSTDNINFNPTLDFDGTNDRLNFGNLANIKSGSDYTIIAVGIRGAGATNYFIGSSGSSNNQALHFGYRGVGTTLALDHYGSSISLNVNAFDNPAETPFLVLGEYDGTNRFIEEARNGILTSSSAGHTTGLLGASVNYIGFNSQNSYFNGLISEVIIYDNDITDADRDKIYSYLAIKYGIELDNTGGGTAGDYTNAAGTILWDASANSTYHNDIAGIGRDGVSELNQKQSKSTNTDAIVSIGLGSMAATNSANSNNFSANNSFMLWGNDNAATAQASANTADLPPTVLERVSRVWKVAETGTVGNVEIQFDMTGLGYGTTLDDFHLIVSNSATMASGTLTAAASINSNVVSFTGVDLSDGQFFSLATKMEAPGAVSQDLSLWLKADEGTNTTTQGAGVTSWNDLGGEAYNATGTGDAKYNTDWSNGNPAVDFTNDFEAITGTISRSNGLGSSLFVVGDFSSSTSMPLMSFEFNGSVNHNLWNNNYSTNPPGAVNFSFQSGQPGLWGVIDPGNANDAFVYENGADKATMTNNLFTQWNTAIYRLGQQGVLALNTGHIAEVIFYDKQLSATERNKVESYLALKYGIELDNTGGGIAGDYTNSMGTTLWDASVNSTYHNDVVGIGRDDDSALNQKQSKSASGDDIVHIGLGSVAATNVANGNSFSADNSFMIWGNDNAATAQASANTADLPATVLERLSRVWKVAETGTVGNVEIQFDLTGLGYGTTLDDFHLIVSNSATMASGTLTAAASINSNVVSFTGVDLTNGQFFSLATKMEAPGAVSQDLSLWLKADAGTNTTTQGAGVTSWNDQGGEAQNATGTGDAKYNTNWSNGNPAVEFTNDLEAMTGAINRSNGLGSSLFVVGDFSSTSMPLMSFLFSGTVNHNFRTNNYSTNPPGQVNYSFQSGQPGLWGAIDPGNANDAFVYENGGDKATMTNNLFTQWFDATYKVAQQGSLALDNGHIAEVIFYDKQLSATERKKIEGYLALKYGIELDNTGGGTNGDYVNAANTTLWDASVNSTYHHDVAGMGRDDDSALNQKQSKSANSDAIVHIGLVSIAATNAANSNSFSADNSFMLWGNDNAATTQASANTADLPEKTLERMSRVWKVEETGTVGNVEIQFDLTGLGYGTTLDDFHLIVSNSATMASGTLTAAASINSNVVSFTGVDLSDGQFFSLATKMEAPGGVTTDLYVWLKADAGTSTTTDNTTLTTWSDQSTAGTDATSDGNPPLFKNNSTDNINFNPTIDFDGIDDRLTLGSLANIKSGAVNGGDYTLVAVGLRQSAIGYLIGSPGGVDHQDLHFGYRSTSVLTLDHWANGLNLSVNAHDNPAETPYVILGEYDGTTSFLEEVRNGTLTSTSKSNSTDLSGTRTNYVGFQSGFSNGLISEIIIYDNDISDTDKDKIYSYLAIKYGIELDNTGGGTAGDYINSAGTTLWDASVNGTYHHDIAGIGRDDNSELIQKQSKSANTDAIVSMGLGSLAATNTANSNSFSADNSFMLWGNDNAATAQASANTADLPAGGITERMSRVWKVAETGTVGNVEIQFDLTGLGYGTTLDDFQLIVSNSATMASGTLTAAASINSNVVSFTGVDLTNGQFFSLATKMEAPGAVSQDLSLWLKADAGTNTTTQGAGVTSWNDLGGEAQNATGTGLAVYETNWTNFNPAISFTDDEDPITGSISRTNGTAGSLFLVGEVSTTNNQNNFFSISGRQELYERRYANSTNDFELGKNQPFVVTASDVGGTGNAIVYKDGEELHTYASKSQNTSWTSGTYILGDIGNSNNGFQLEGHIAEVIYYDRQIPVTEQQKVESYLAIKYGISLGIDNDGDGTPLESGSIEEGDYVNAAGTTLWDASANSTYHSDVAGVGRDDDSALNQKQSKSANTDAIVSMGLGSLAATNTANSNSFSANNSFMLWGNDNAATAQASANTSDLPAGGITERMSRVWKVAETGTVGNVEIQFDLTGLGYGTTLDDFQLIVSNSATMASGTLTAAASINSNVVSFTGVDLTNGQFFSLATKMEAPGAVSQDLSLWLKADAGTNTTTQGAGVTSWNDLGGEAQNATGTGLAVYETNWTNFNPAISFTDDEDPITGSISRTNGTAGSLFLVGEVSTTNNQNNFFSISGRQELYERRYANSTNDFELGKNQPFVVTASDVGGTGNAIVYKDGEELHTYASKSQNTSWTSGTYILGDIGNSNNGFQLEGHIAEVIYYDRQIPVTEQQKVESYLAIKYGISLGIDNDGDGTPLESGSIEEGDYVNAAGTTLWDASANSTYHNDVAGVGRDDDSALNQKQSKNTSTDAIVSMGLGSLAATNTANSNSFSADNSFMLWGNDNAATAQASANTADLPSTVLERMSRVWKVAETGTVGNVEIQFNLTGLGYGTTLDDFHLIISNTATMASGTLTAAASINSNVVSFTGVDLSDGQFFSLATQMEAPGAVSQDLSLWLKADAGTNTTTQGAGVTSWSDLGGEAHNATGTGDAKYNTNWSNGNPAVEFTNDVDAVTGTVDRNNGGGSSLFVVGEFSSSTSMPLMSFTFGVSTNHNLWNNNYSSNPPGQVNFSLLRDQPGLWGAIDPGDANDAFVYENGADKATMTNNLFTQWFSATYRLAQHATFPLDNGHIAEVIFYDKQLSATERHKVESYLALKYGIELDNTGGGTAGDYINSAGTTFWDASANSTYHHNVAGIGRDDDSALNQKQSKSANSDAIVKIGIDGNSNGLESTNADNPSTFSTDNAFLVWGHDGEALTDRDENIDFDPLQVKSRLNREWRVQETGTISSVVVQFDISAIEGLTGPGTSDESQVVLLVDNDSDFSSGASLVLQSFVTPDDGLVNFNVDFSSGQYFTLASSEENALAVSLISFEAKHQNNAIQLTWSTGSEEANSLFRIERSADGERFEAIGHLEGANSSAGQQQYEFSDNNPLIGTNYYRLIDIDLTGKENASEMIRVIFHPSTEISPPYPNPVRQGDYITVPMSGRTSHALTVFSASGVQQQVSWFERGGLLYVSTANLRAGQYIFRVKTPQYARTHKVFVLNN